MPLVPPYYYKSAPPLDQYKPKHSPSKSRPPPYYYKSPPPPRMSPPPPYHYKSQPPPLKQHATLYYNTSPPPPYMSLPPPYHYKIPTLWLLHHHHITISIHHHRPISHPLSTTCHHYSRLPRHHLHTTMNSLFCLHRPLRPPHQYRYNSTPPQHIIKKITEFLPFGSAWIATKSNFRWKLFVFFCSPL